MAGSSSADADLKPVTLTVTGQRTAGVDVVSAQPDGTELSLDTPDNRINAQLSVTKHDMSFWDLTDPALTGEVHLLRSGGRDSRHHGRRRPGVHGYGADHGHRHGRRRDQVDHLPGRRHLRPARRHRHEVPEHPHVAGRLRRHQRAAPTGPPPGVQLSASLVPAAAGATYSYQIAPMDTNTAGATCDPGGSPDREQGRTRAGHGHRDRSGVKTSESALIQIPPVQQDATVGGNVPATLALTLGAPATFGSFTPGVAKDYLATTTANVISTAGDAHALDR